MHIIKKKKKKKRHWETKILLNDVCISKKELKEIKF